MLNDDGMEDYCLFHVARQVPLELLHFVTLSTFV